MLRILIMLIVVAGVPGFQTNNQPIVTIINPKSNDRVMLNNPVRYTIHVSDKEDGDTKYDEIPANEILLEVRPVADTAVAAANVDLSGLHAMMKSNCMNCHAFESKLIGPSFNDIANKYDGSSIDQLISRVRDGSTGVWGDIPMPTHHELTTDQTKAMVQWILDRRRDEQAKYYLGTEGSFRLPPSTEERYVRITASYLDKAGSLGKHSVYVVRSEK